MATVLGMLFFVGILFTCIIPLFIYVNKLNSYYYRAMTETREFDLDRGRESIDVYAYPLSDPINEINVYIKNRSPFSVDVVRVWTNNYSHVRWQKIPAMDDCIIESIQVELTETKPFYIKVSTARGNSFSSFTNPLYYKSDGEGSWSGGMGFTIQIVIETPPPQNQRFFHISVTDYGDFTYESDVVKKSRESSCFTAVAVPLQGTYHVTVTENQTPIPVTPESVTVTLSQRSQFVYAEAP